MESAMAGTVIHGTLRAEDLIPAFISELRTLANGERSDHDKLTREITKRISDTPDYYETDDAQIWDLELLFDALNDYAPDGHYFGAHEGDGSDFGFWALNSEPF